MAGMLAAIPGMFASAAPVAAEAGAGAIGAGEAALGASAIPVAAESLYSTMAPADYLTTGPESLVGYPTSTAAVPAASSGGGLGSLLNYAGPISSALGLFNWTPPPYAGPQFSKITPEMFGRNSARNLYDSMQAPPSYGISPLEQESVYGRRKA